MTPPRSSLAIALQDYRGPRPGIALTIAALALIAALIVGIVHAVMLGRSGVAIADGREAMRTLHRYSAALEVWRQMALQPVVEFPAQQQSRDSLAASLRADLGLLRDAIADPGSRELLATVVSDLESWTPERPLDVGLELGTRAREAMIVLTARQDSILLETAQRYHRSQLLVAVLIGLTVVAASVLIVPMSWVYVRYKQGVPPGM